MNLTNGALSKGSKHPDVAVLHTELAQLDFAIDQAEIDEGFFGSSTRQAVLVFQRTRNLQITGIVDEETAAAINAEVDAIDTSRRIVWGSVRFESGQPVSDVRVLAYQAGLDTDELLGHSNTDQQGAYRIAYSLDEPNIALRVRVVNPLGVLLAFSDRRFNATNDETIDIVIASPENVHLSHYETILAAIASTVGDTPLARLSKEQMAFVAGNTGQDLEVIQALVRATSVAEETRLLSPAVFFAFAQAGFPLELDELLMRDPQEWRETLVASIDEGVVPARMADNLDTIIDRLSELASEFGLLVTHTASGRLLDEATGGPLTGFLVSVSLPGDQDSVQDVTKTGEDGTFDFAYTTPRGGDNQSQRLVFHITSPQGDTLPGVFEHTVSAADDESFDLPVPVPAAPSPPTLSELADQLNLNLPQDLLPSLAQQGIENLEDLQQAGGLEALLGGPLVDDQVAELEAHVRLSILPTSLVENTALIDAGFTNPRTIAEANRVDFVDRVGGVLGDLGAATVREQGMATAFLLDSYVTDAIGEDWVYTPTPPGGASDPDLDLDSDITDVFPPACQCQECLSAVSPIAYLADLLKYATGHLKRIPAGANNGPLMSLDDLAGRFHQPFGELVASCEEVERTVRQIRICIEVLRRFLNQENLPLPGSPEEAALELAQRRYLEQAYQRILAEVGTSYEELRDSRSADDATQEALATRLGLDPQQLNRLDELFLDAGELDESALEQLFGLPSTFGLSVSPGVQPDFLTWQLERLRNGWREEDANVAKPIIDPDVLGPEYLKSLTDTNGFFDLWQARASAIQLKLDEIGAIQAAATNDQDWLNSAFQNTLGVTAQDLVALESRRDQGENIDQDLENLALTNAAFDYLLGVWNLAAQDQPILDSEASNATNILVQVHKQRDLYAIWRQEEVARDVILGPDHFIIPGPSALFPAVEPRPLPEWRASQTELTQRRSTLLARIEQVETRTEVLNLAVEVAEEAALPALRDALIIASGRSASQLTDDLLIDCQMDGCAKTTRVAMAIETIQLLLWSVRTGQLNDSHPDLELDDDDFDEAWKWLGSYETWRAAIFVLLYPENILQPALRPNKTPVFQRIVAQTQTNRRLSPAKVRRQARTYAAYLADVANLKIGASCYATAQVPNDGPYQGTIANTRDYVYFFAHAEASRKVYWSRLDPQDDSGFAHSFWRKVPGLDDVSNIIGADVYHISPTQRYIYLFATTEQFDHQRLVYTRLNLDQVPFQWDDEPTEINTPNSVTSFEATVVQSHNVDKAPELGLEIPANDNRKSIYRGRLVSENLAGPQDWIVWTPLEVDSFKKLLAMVGWGDDGVLAFSTFVDNSEVTVRYYSEFGAPGTGLARLPDSVDFDSWQGAFRWPGAENLAYAFWQVGGTMRYTPLWGNRKPFFPDRPYAATFTGNLAYFAPHNAAQSESPNRLTMAFQRRGASGGPFYSTFQRVPTPGFSYSINPATSRDEREGFGGLTITALRLDNGRFDSLSDGDLIGGFDPFPPTPPLPPIPPDDTPPPDLIKLVSVEAVRLAPRIDEPLDIVAPLSENEQGLRRVIMASSFQDNLPGPRSNLAYLEEAYYFLPVHLALQLHRNHHFVEALDWFRTVYDYGLPPTKRKIYYGLILEESFDQRYERPADCLLDPLMPHNIAGQRRNAYTRFTVLSIVKCLLAYADREFGRDTVESVARARVLYLTALGLLNPSDTEPDDCQSLIIDLDTPVGGDLNGDFGEWRPIWDRYRETLAEIDDPGRLSSVADDITAIWASADPVPARLARVEARVTAALASEPEPVPLSVVLAEREKRMARAYALLQRRAGVSTAVTSTVNAVRTDLQQVVADVAGVGLDALDSVDLSWLGERAFLAEANDTLLPVVASGSRAQNGTNGRHSEIWEDLAEVAPLHLVMTGRRTRLSFAPGPNYQFCVPANPLLDALRRHARLSLDKIRSCRNIAGEVRELAPYAAPIEIDAGLPAFGSDGQIFVPQVVRLSPTPYRYITLIERSKLLVGHAQQLEAALLSALEKYDEESYRLLQARIDLRLSRAGLRLQQLRLQTAETGVYLAALQYERTRTQEAFYRQLLSERSTTEMLSLSAEWMSLFANPAGIGSFLGGFASFERREQDWEQQLSLAMQEAQIGLFQIIAASNERRAAAQEVNIAELNLSHAEATADFLVNKFTSAELYEWMSEVLERAYRFFLQQATALARLAESQLAFERQETPPPFIQSDYWDVPLGLGSNAGDAPDRRGLTGSARLLQDIFQLDQYAFETDRRKQQLTKSISLVQLAPAEFQRFRSTGVLIFATPMDLFDRDFPGHYLRLIKRVRISMIALIPTTVGIKATLASTGISRAVVNNNGIFETVTITRPPETISLSSPSDATGLFDLTPQASEMLLPFENIGVDTSWELQLPKAANQFDYNTIADVLVTIEYTALNSFDYRRQVVQELGNSFSADRLYSFRVNFADQWYRLNNPLASNTPLTARFEVRRTDFPPNLEGEIIIEHLVLYIVRSDDTVEVDATLSFPLNNQNIAPVGGTASSIDGVISTRRGNVGQWLALQGLSPFGEWELQLPPVTATLFDDEQIEDIVFVITYSGQTSSWPM